VINRTLLLLFSAILLHVLVTDGKGQVDRLRMAQTYEAGGDLRSAARIYLEIHEADPTRDAAFQGVVRTLIGLRQFESLLPMVIKQDERKPSTATAMLAAQLSAQLSKRAEAVSWWDKAVEREAGSESIHAAVAKAQADARMYTESVASYLRARKGSVDPYSYARELSTLYASLGEIEKATEETLNEHRLTQDQTSTTGRLSALMSMDSTGKRVGAVLLSASDVPGSLRLKAWYYRTLGDWPTALKITKQIDDEENQRGNEILRFADAARREGAYDIALDAYNIVLKSGSKQVALVASFGVVRTLDQRISSQVRIDTSEALSIISRYREIIKANPDHPLTADALYRAAVLCDDILHDVDQARDFLTALTNRWKGTAAAANGALLLADLYVAAGRTDAADDILTELVSSDRNVEADVRDLALLRRSDLKLFQGDQATAKSGYLEIIKRPASLAANDALERLTLLTLAIDDSAAVASFFVGSNALIRRDIAGAAEAFRQASLLATDPEVKDRCIFNEAKAYYQLGLTDRARTTLEAVIARVPDSIFGDRALVLLADCYERQGQTSEAIAALTTLLVQYPRSILAPSSRERIRRLRGDA
jgi:tetratricopeptide (TPR) repeat protein